MNIRMSMFFEKKNLVCVNNRSKLLTVVFILLKRSENGGRYVTDILISRFSNYHILVKPAIAAMHGPHSVFDIGHCTVIHYDGRGVSLVTNENLRKTYCRVTDQLLDVSSNR